MAPEMTTIPAGFEPTGVVDMFCMGILILYVSVDLLVLTCSVWALLSSV